MTDKNEPSARAQELARSEEWWGYDHKKAHAIDALIAKECAAAVEAKVDHFMEMQREQITDHAKAYAEKDKRIAELEATLATTVFNFTEEAAKNDTLKARVEELREALEVSMKGNGSLLWVGNNMRNYGGQHFKTFLEGAIEAAQIGYDSATETLAAPSDTSDGRGEENG